MKFIWKEGYDQMQSIVSRCWLDPNGHGLPPPFIGVLVGCQVGMHRVVYSAMVDELGKWQFPEFQGNENDVTVLFWMPKPDVSMRFDTAFAFQADMMEAVLNGVNLEAQLTAALRRAQDAEDGQERSEQLRAAAVERENNAIGERDIAREEARRAEAALTAVPVQALRRTLLTGYRTDAQITADADAINAWFGGDAAESKQDAGLLVDTLGGMCPTQAEGTMGGNPFYFRARHGSWELRVVKPGCDPVWPDNKEDLLLNWSGDDPSNGWMEEPDVMAVLQRASELLASARV